MFYGREHAPLGNKVHPTTVRKLLCDFAYGKGLIQVRAICYFGIFICCATLSWNIIIFRGGGGLFFCPTFDVYQLNQTKVSEISLFTFYVTRSRTGGSYVTRSHTGGSRIPHNPYIDEGEPEKVGHLP